MAPSDRAGVWELDPRGEQHTVPLHTLEDLDLSVTNSAVLKQAKPDVYPLLSQ